MKVKRMAKQNSAIKCLAPRQNFYNYYKAKANERSQLLKKEGQDSESSATVKKVECKKKLKRPNCNQNKTTQTNNWLAIPLSNTGLVIDSESSVDEEEEKETLNNISSIYQDASTSSISFSDEDFDGMVEDASESQFDIESNHESDLRFFQKMKEDKCHLDSPAAKKQKLSQSPQNVKHFPVKFRNTIICLLNHPTSIALHGYVSVEVLSGSVSICGHELNPESPKVKIFSSQSTGFSECKTETYDHLWMRKDTFMSLNQELKMITGSIKEARRILGKFGNTTVAVVIKECVPTPQLHFLSLYYESILSFTLKCSKKKRKPLDQKKYFFPTNKEAIQFSTEMEDLALAVNFNIQNAKVQELDGPRLLIFGSGNTGKSTALRFLMNKVLTKFPAVYYLDADPGQTEFSPSGVISLTRVTSPVFGPPFSHQRKPVAMSFIGSVSAGTSIDMYNKCVMKMSQIYFQHFGDQPLFINTMGWLKGLGLECLKNLMQILNPSILVEMLRMDNETMLDFRQYVPDNVEIHQIQSRAYKKTSKKMRKLSLLSYFGKCLKWSQKPVLLNGLKPVCVSWDQIAIYLCDRKIVPFRLVECLNASVVALCKVPDSIILESHIPDFPKTLENDPENDCIGFGIVSSIDEERRLLYIITPLSLHELKHVNAVMKGNIVLPTEAYLKQQIYKLPLPFTDEREHKAGLDDNKFHPHGYLDDDDDDEEEEEEEDDDKFF